MSKTTHTPEPWKAARGHWWRDRPHDPRLYHMTAGPAEIRLDVAPSQVTPEQIEHLEADARRIVACVNACAGIDTAALEALGTGGIQRQNERLQAHLVRSIQECPTCYGKGHVERRANRHCRGCGRQQAQPEPNRIGASLEPCETCVPLRDALAIIYAEERQP